MCYQLPALVCEGTAIIVSPLIALMKNQVDAMRQVSDSDEIAHFLNSSLTKADILKVKKDIQDGKTKMLYIKEVKDNTKKSKNVKIFYKLTPEIEKQIAECGINKKDIS